MMSDGGSHHPTPSQNPIPIPIPTHKTNPHRTHPQPPSHLIAGLVSGLSTSILLQPADLLKTRVQQSRSSSLVPVLRSLLSGPRPVSSLWRGTVPSALRTGLGSGLYFSTLNALRQGLARRGDRERETELDAAAAAGIITSTSVAVGGNDGNGNGSRGSIAVPSLSSSSSSSSSVLPRLTGSQNLLAGAISRVFAGFWLMPITVIKVRYESDLYAYRSMLGASRDIVARQGLAGFFSGFGATALRDAPYAGLYILFYEGSKTKLTASLAMAQKQAQIHVQTHHDDAGGGSGGGLAAAAVNFTSGVYAAGLATTVTNPFDAVKTRMQLLPAKYGSMVKATRLMMREDGIRSFFDGLALRIGRKALSSALAWTVYEELIARAEFSKLSDEKRHQYSKGL